MKKGVSRLKIILGYVLIVGALLYSLAFVDKEMGNLMLSSEYNTQWEDSLMTLLREKDQNTIRLLRTLSEMNDSLLSAGDIEQIIARHDTVIIRQQVKQRIITRHDTIRTPKKKKKGFFRRLGEAFSPPKEDTTIQVLTSTEVAMDTVFYDTYNPVDSLEEQLRSVAQKRQEQNVEAKRRSRYLRRLDKMLNARIDSLLKGYEQDVLVQAHQEEERRQAVRQHSARVISGIAIGAVSLAAFFLILIGRDVARSNRYRRELEEARRKAEELLATREKLMLAITHDFKAPLGSIMGYADLLARLTEDERQRFYLDNMKTSSEHLLKLVTDLLDFHRLDLHKVEVNRVAFRPARLLEEVCVSFEPLMTEKGLRFEHPIATELENTYICDPLRLRQIINNLVSNAVKFTEQGGITLRAEYKERQLVVSVTDTGKGMKPADRERIFQEFTRLPDAQGKEGFGLGLSIVKMLVQLLEGTIEVDSVPGKGSTFTVHIPIYPLAGQAHETPAPAELDEPRHSSAPLPPGHLHVLLIDDDRLQLMLTTAMLSQQGITSVACEQVDALLDALRGESFDVLLTDVQMPAMNGFDLLNLLRASNIPQARIIPVIAVTARSDMEREEFTAHGFSGCLHKPFNVSELLRELGTPLQSSSPGEAPAVEALSAGESLGEVSDVLDFAALTAFAEGDEEAARSILESFVRETRQNAGRLRQALEKEQAGEIAAIAHKMIPLFTLIGALSLVKHLRALERLQDRIFSDQVKETTEQVLGEVEELVQRASARLNL